MGLPSTGTRGTHRSRIRGRAWSRLGHGPGRRPAAGIHPGLKNSGQLAGQESQMAHPARIHQGLEGPERAAPSSRCC